MPAAHTAASTADRKGLGAFSVSRVSSFLVITRPPVAVLRHRLRVRQIVDVPHPKRQQQGLSLQIAEYQIVSLLLDAAGPHVCRQRGGKRLVALALEHP